MIGLVAAARALIHALAEEADLGFALRHGVARKFVAQIGQREFEARRNFERAADGLRQVREQARHFGGRLDVALRIAFEQPAGLRKRRFVADAGEHVEQFALRGSRVGHSVSGHQRNAEPPRAFDNHPVARFFLAVVMALDLGVDVAASEDIEQPLAGMARDADQAAREFGELVERGRAFAFFGAQLHAGNQAAEVLIAFAGFSKQGIGGAVDAIDFRADMRADPRFLRGHVEARSAVDAVAVHQRHGRHAEFRARAGQFLGHGSAFQKAEAGARVKFDVGVFHDGPQPAC